MSTNDTTVHFLGRCQCGYALRTEEGSAQTVERYRDMETPSLPYRMGAQYYVRCPEGHKPFKLYRVEGEFSEAFECDARCENAKGHTCKCSCGGMNHGKAYAVQPSEIVHVENSGAAIANAKFRSPREGGTIEDRSWNPEEQKGEPAYERPRRLEKVFVEGAEGDEREFLGKLIAKKDTTNSTLYTFAVKVGQHEAIVKSFVPSFAIPDPDPEVRDMVEFTAIIKEHQDHPDYGKSTLVNYLKVIGG